MTVYMLGDVQPQLPSDGDYWIAPDANVIGNVHLASGVSVWFGSTLRGDDEPIKVAQGTNLQEQTVIHVDPGFPCTVGQNCTIGHKALLHGCTIGDGTLIGMGATILNGAVIGKGCLVGAGALVTEGKVIPDGSMVLGMPGKVVRSLSPEQMQANLDAAKRYQSRMRMYRSSLAAVSAEG